MIANVFIYLLVLIFHFKQVNLLFCFLSWSRWYCVKTAEDPALLPHHFREREWRRWYRSWQSGLQQHQQQTEVSIPPQRHEATFPKSHQPFPSSPFSCSPPFYSFYFTKSVHPGSLGALKAPTANAFYAYFWLSEHILWQPLCRLCVMQRIVFCSFVKRNIPEV